MSGWSFWLVYLLMGPLGFFVRRGRGGVYPSSLFPPRFTKSSASALEDKMTAKTHKRYIVSPTAVPINAALNAVDTIDPARPFLLFAGGSSNFTRKSSSMPNRDRE